MSDTWWLLAVLASLLLVVGGAWPRWRRRRLNEQLDRARQLFHWRREWLEVEFLTMAARSGMPRGLTWDNCEFSDEAVFARDRATKQLQAFAAVAIRFQALPDGGLEVNPTLWQVREATAVFRFDGRDWQTDGRAIFNLNPLETVERFQHELQVVD